MKKAEQYRIKVTTYIQGETKNNFLTELNAKGLTEAELTRQIIAEHYANKKGNNRSVY